MYICYIINCGRGVKRNSLSIQLREGRAVLPFRSKMFFDIKDFRVV
jgi:hypothetical protein